MRKQILGLVAACFAMLTLSTANAAATDAGIVLVATNATATNAAGETRPLARRDAIEAGETIKTTAGGSVQLKMKDEAVITLGENAELAVNAYTFKGAGDAKDQALLKLAAGSLTQLSGQMEKAGYALETPVSTLGIRGTIFHVEIGLETGEANITVIEGSIEVTLSNGQKVAVAAGQKLVFKADGSTEVVAADAGEIAFILRIVEVTEGGSFNDIYTDTIITDTDGITTTGASDKDNVSPPP